MVSISTFFYPRLLLMMALLLLGSGPLLTAATEAESESEAELESGVGTWQPLGILASSLIAGFLSLMFN